ncbi:GntR family transcriptional regulator [Propionibacteriaceae bacterium G1746]|uniref:GntR family transcriptional regulator n=1 Tax=Aestuariimicrobium sp. G57 TaxID=3418485 RepID=UPI003C2178B2
MGLTVRVVAADPTPPYEQLRRQLADAVATGELTPGDRLPPVRQLARDLGVATGTVARAYRLLEESGQLVTARGAGTRVAANRGTSSTPTAPDGQLQRLAADFVAQTRALGAPDEVIEAAVRRALQR